MNTFDATKNDNNFWDTLEYFTAISNDLAGKLEWCVRAGYGLKADQTDEAAVTTEIEAEGFNLLVGIASKVQSVDVATMSFIARANWSTAKGEGWKKIVSGKCLFLVWNPNQMNENNFDKAQQWLTKATADMAALSQAQADLAALKKTGCEPGGGTYGAGSSKGKGKCGHEPEYTKRAARIKELEEEIMRITSVVVWTEPQKNSITKMYEEIENGLGCCYDQDKQRISQLYATYIDILSQRGPDAFSEVEAAFNNHKDLWMGKGHHTTKGKCADSTICSNFDVDPWLAEITALCEKYLNRIGTSPAGPGSVTSSWYSKMAPERLKNFFKGRRDAIKAVRDGKKEGRAENYFLQLLQNFKEVVVGAPRAMARPDGEFGFLSYSLGMLGAAILTPLALVGGVLMLPVDGVAKMFSEKSVTARWSSNWFVPTVKG